jgi:hypothetical protein
MGPSSLRLPSSRAGQQHAGSLAARPLCAKSEAAPGGGRRRFWSGLAGGGGRTPSRPGVCSCERGGPPNVTRWSLGTLGTPATGAAMFGLVRSVGRPEPASPLEIAEEEHLVDLSKLPVTISHGNPAEEGRQIRRFRRGEAAERQQPNRGPCPNVRRCRRARPPAGASAGSRPGRGARRASLGKRLVPRRALDPNCGSASAGHASRS